VHCTVEENGIEEMIGTAISEYTPRAHPLLADKILERLGDAGMGVMEKERVTQPDRAVALTFVL